MVVSLLALAALNCLVLILEFVEFKLEKICQVFSRLLTAGLKGLPEAEGNEILDQLLDHVEKPEFVYEHVWSPGDFVIWDNRCLNHARTDFSAGERRLLRRTTVQGVRPEPAQAVRAA